MGVDPADNSYMPSVIIVSGGTTSSSLAELNVVYVRNNDTCVTLLSNMDQVKTSFVFFPFTSFITFIIKLIQLLIEYIPKISVLRNDILVINI